MNIKFRYYNYATIVKKNQQKEFSEYICFRAILENHQPKDIYIVKIYKGEEFCKDGTKNHYCPFNKLQINKWLQYINKYLYKFKYKLVEKSDCFLIKVDTHSDRIHCLFVLTCIRYLYEFPYNVHLYEAFRLKKITGFKSFSIIDLINLVNRTMFTEYNAGHGFGECKHITLSKLRNNIKNMLSINSCFDLNYAKYEKFPSKQVYESKFWISDNKKYIEQRIQFYNQHKKEFLSKND